MAEYRIVAKLDPQTGPGTQKVKQDLRGVQTEARATGNEINRAFDSSKFDKSIGTLSSAIDRLDKTISGLATSQGNLAKSNATLGQTIDRLAASSTKATGATKQQGNASDQAGASAARLEGALRRVLQATDAEAAEQLRLNQLLREAKMLLDAGAISSERYAQVQRLVAQNGQGVVQQTGAQRMGLQQLGFQLGDVATMYQLGAKPAQIFASQIGQVTQAVMLLGGPPGGGALGAVGKFLSGPWGIALTLGVIMLSPFIGKLFESGDALDEKIDKMKKDARESEETRIVHERWTRTLDGLIARQYDLTKAMRERMKVQELSTQQDLRRDQRDQKQLTDALTEEKKRNEDLRNQLTQAQRPVAGGATMQGAAALQAQQARVAQLRSEIAASDQQIAKLNVAVGDVTERVTSGQILLGEEQGKALTDLTERAKQMNAQYTNSMRGILTLNAELRDQAPQVSAGVSVFQAAIEKAAGSGVNFGSAMGKAVELAKQLRDGRIDVAGYRTEMQKLADALTAAAKKADDAKKSVGSGIATFRNTQQAIGIAGRELQSAGFRVSENPQFGGVTPGVHEGRGHAEGRAIDINVGRGVVEANVPDIMNRLNAMAVRYAARGYIVLWNGKRYDPSGKVTPYPGHYDHMHLEAPSTIVGKPTQASTEAQARREEQQGIRLEERAEDFVAGVIRGAEVKGVASNAKAQLESAIANKLQEFKDRFEREANPDEKAAITKALTDADARETARRFEEAYVNPLKRLQELQGKTGIDRQILNAQLEETARLGRELTPVEKEMIENGIRRGDQLERENQLLQELRGPLDEYAAYLRTLNDLLAKGEISQAAYNARIAELKNNATQTALGGLTGVDPASGRHYEDIAATSEEDARYAEQLAKLDEFRRMKIDLGVSYDTLELEYARQHQENLRKIDQARRDQQLDAMQGIAGSVTDIMRNAFGEQSRIARAAFVAEKAVAIARAIIAIQTGIAQAAALPFPANLPAIASVVAATASIVSNIRSATIGYKDGGMITGPGGPRDDKIPIMASNGEFMVNAEATKKYRPLLEKMNNGGGGAFADGGLVKEFPVPVRTANDNLGVVTSPGGVTRTLDKDGKPLNPADDPALTAEQRNSIYLERIATATEGMFKLMEKAEERRKKNRKWNVLKGFLTGGIIGGALTALTEFDAGGWTGDDRTDKETGRVHGQEFVVKSPYARQNRTLLEAINSGRQVRQAQDQRVAQAMGHTMTAAPPVVNVSPPPVRLVIVKDEDEAKRYLDSYEGEAHFIKLVNNNADTVARAAGQSGA